jgi:4-diphosphocytidyl-2-C-methyl-D-erythritol kinase
VISARAQGKINLYFAVGAKRPDGYHDVLSLYQALDVFEEVAVTPASNWGVSIESNLPAQQLGLIPLDESNLVVNAAKRLARFAGVASPQPMHFTITKNIPVAGGMAGGSADAAAALVALNEAWALGLNPAQLREIGALVGADVPFALMGGTAIGTGTGAELEAITLPKPFHVLLLQSEFGLSTKTVFDKFDDLHPAGSAFLDSNSLLQILENFGEHFGANALTGAALALRPELQKLLELDLGISKGMLSGSGPTIWFYSETEDSILKARDILTKLGHKVLLSATSNLGARLS